MLVEISNALGGLPLTLEQAGSFLDATQSSPEDYPQLLNDVESGTAVFDEAQSRPATGYERSAIATLTLAYNVLSPAAQTLLRLCAYAGGTKGTSRALGPSKSKYPRCAAGYWAKSTPTPSPA